MTNNEIRAIKNEIMNAKTQEDVAEAVDEFDDSADIDMNDEVYSESDMQDNIDNLDDFHEPNEIKDPSKYSKDQLDLWKHDACILDRLADDDYPEDDDLFFHEDGDPVSVKDLQDIALGMLNDDTSEPA